MSENKPRKIVLPQKGFIDGLTQRIKLIIRLIGDPRISPLLKILPIGSLVYLIIPDLAPGPIDDAALMWLGSYLFVELCPPEVVAEHQKALNQVVSGQWQNSQDQDEDVVDAEFRERP